MDGSLHASTSAARRALEHRPHSGDARALHGFSQSALDGSMLSGTIGRHMQLGPGRLRGSIERARFNQIGVRTTQFSSAVRAVIETPPDIVTLGFALQAPEPFIIAGERLPVGTLSIFGAGGVNDVTYPAGATAVTLALPMADYDRQIQAVSGLDLLRSGHAALQLAAGPELTRLRDVVGAVGQLNADPAAPIDDPQWGANVERALLDVFFDALATASPSPMAVAPSGRLHSARAIVREADARMDVVSGSIPSIQGLCGSLGVSRRTLERAFQDVLDMSPAHYLRVRALNAAREQLMRRRPEPGVITRVAFDNGFWHMGRFSVSYRALFGERPIDTVGRLHRPR